MFEISAIQLQNDHKNYESRTVLSCRGSNKSYVMV